MPRVCIDVPMGTDAARIEKLRTAARQATHVHLQTRNPKYDYVAVREVHADLGDGVPVVSVDLRVGRDSASKKAFVAAVSEALCSELHVASADVCVVFREVDASNYYIDGEPIAPFVPKG